MSFFQALWPFSRTDAGTGAKPAASAPPGPAPVPEPDDTDAEPDDTDAAAPDIGARPVIPGCLVWNLNTESCEWEFPREAASVAAPTAQQDLECWFPERADDDAVELYEALIAWGYGGTNVLLPELVVLYMVLCVRLHLEPGPWIRVGAALRRITRGRKTYPWIKFTDGVSRRVRSYHIPLPTQENVVDYPAPAFAEARSAA